MSHNYGMAIGHLINTVLVPVHYWSTWFI